MKRPLIVSAFVLFAIQAALTACAPSASAATVGKPPNNNGLTGWWTLDEGTGTVAHDLSGGGHNGTLTGGTWTNGKKERAILFNGTTDNLRAAGYNAGSTQTKTIAFWFKPASLVQSGAIIDMTADTNDYKWQYIQQCNQSLSFMFGDNSFYNERGNCSIGNVFTQANVWYHVAVTVDVTQAAGSRVKVYVNGVAYTPSFDNDTGNPFYDGTDLNLYVGGANLGQGGITSADNATIDDVRIYNRALSASDVLKLYQSGQVTRKAVSENGLAGWWTFDEGTSTKAHDFSGNGNTASLVASPTWAIGKKGGGRYH